jgi:hypothetical protein
MPDPSAVARIQNKGGQVYYAKDEFISAAKLVSPDDVELTLGNPRGSEPLGPRAKKVKAKVWLVTLELPRVMLNKVSNSTVETDMEKLETEKMETQSVEMDNQIDMDE